MKKKGHSPITKGHVWKAVGIYGHATRGLLALDFYGQNRRAKALEVFLPQLEREGRLTATWHNGEKVYSVARKNRVKAASNEHELGWVEVLIRLRRCRMTETEIVLEKAFRRFGIVPECGLRFTEKRGTMLLVEFTTNKNFTRQGGGVVKSKLTRYRKYLPDIEEWAQRKVTVLFVIDSTREEVRRFVLRQTRLLEDSGASGDRSDERFPFFFTDFTTFRNQKMGSAFTALIYFWKDGKEWALTNHD